MPANAQFADTPCDPKYYESLEAKAWLEAQREITQNQNLIFKPDSVLEYTCFDKHLNVLAQQALNMFSETTRWGTILPSNSMDTALTNLVGQALGQYITANFSHRLLGHRSTANATVSSSVSGESYSCNVMNNVWKEAKCMNFIHTEAEDGFFTFEKYKDDPDKRFLPTRCSQNTQWEDNIKKAYQEPEWKPDNVETFLETFYPTSGCGEGDSSKIKTGLKVRRGKGDPKEYDEHICLVPGCYYDASGGQCTQ